MSAFHEVYYYNILQLGKANGQAQASITSGLKAIMIDPFMTLGGIKKASELINSNSILRLNPQSNNSSDSETDDSMSISQDISPKRNPIKEVNCYLLYNETSLFVIKFKCLDSNFAKSYSSKCLNNTR